MRVALDTVVEGRYRVGGTLGRGAMAVVYLVRHEQLGTLHAMKVLELPSSVVRRRLLTEGTIQAALRSPHVVPVTDVVEVEGCPALIMELVHGPSLERLLAEGPLPLDVVRSLGTGILLGVQAAHRHGTIHRDLKPANVLVDVADGRLVARITDFGLARALHPEASGGGATRSGTTLGTPAYMAPEQIRDARSVDERADVFGLGAVLYELVAGERAFPGDDLLEIYDAIRVAQTRPLRSLRPDATEAMVRTVEAALKVDLEERAQSVDALLELWTEGRGAGALACDAPDALLATVGRLGPDTASTSSATSSSGATFDLRGEVEALPSAMVELVDETPEAAVGPRRWPWVAGTLGLVVAVAVVCGLSGTVAGVGTVGALRHLRGGSPVVEPGPAPTRPVRIPGMEALMAADPAGAAQVARATLAAAGERPCAQPDACAVLAVALLQRDDPEGYAWLDRASREVTDDELRPLVLTLRAVSREGPVAARDLMQVGVRTRRGAVVAMLVGVMASLPPPLRLEVTGGALEHGAEGPLRLTRVRLLLAEGRVVDAATELEQVPEAARGDWHRTATAEVALASGDVARARRELTVLDGPRARWIQGAATRADGGPEVADALWASLTDPSARTAVTLGRADAAVGRGAWSEAVRSLGEAMDASSEADLATRTWVATHVVQLAVALDDQALTARAALLLRGVASELVGAESVADRLRADADALERGMGPAKATAAGRCVGPLLVARARSGRPAEESSLAEISGPDSACLVEGVGRLVRAEAHARSAVLALAGGDATAAAEHLAAYDALLPEAELALPFYADIEKVREDLADPL
ncbi:MAG: serine/threonine protein kinase [Alphaproteobacteria bacterium]|nr:serine/threonine protein kinase [Alphaproteobacteria bacterium]MCB9698854.1 serine/threonine protein kinase [Alphaproteobacteria bacterium]